MNQDTNRLLMELERTMRATNREIINPQIHELTIDGMLPVLRMVAHARARYLKALFALGDGTGENGERPTDAQFANLRRLRLEYDEMTNASKALEAAIQRGYLDVQPS